MAEIVDAWIEDAAGDRTQSVGQDDPFSLCMDIQFHEDLQDPIFGFRARNELGHVAIASRTDWYHGPSGRFLAGERRTVRMRFQNMLAPGRYTYTPSVVRAGLGNDALDIREDYTDLIVHGTKVTGGQVDVPYDLEIGPA